MNAAIDCDAGAASTTIRGVITSLTITDPNRSRLPMISDSCGLKTPCLAPMSAMARKSLRLNALSTSSFFSALVSS